MPRSFFVIHLSIFSAQLCAERKFMDQKKSVSGPMAELLRQFSVAYRLGKGEAGSGERLAVLGNILEAPRSTLEGWFKECTPPCGKRAPKVQLLLSLCGFEADERTQLSPMLRLFFDTVVTASTVEDAAKELGVLPENVLIWVRGEISPKSTAPLVAFNEKHAEKRQAKIRTWKRTLQENGFTVLAASSPPAGIKPVPVPVVVQQAVVASRCDTRIADEALIYQMRALRAMIRTCGVLSDEGRKKAIRQAVGYDELAELLGDVQRLMMAPAHI